MHDKEPKQTLNNFDFKYTINETENLPQRIDNCTLKNTIIQYINKIKKEPSVEVKENVETQLPNN